MKKKVRVVTTTKGHTYDPQGAAVLKSLQQLGIKHIEDVKIGRHILLYIEDDAPEEEIMGLLKHCRSVHLFYQTL